MLFYLWCSRNEKERKRTWIQETMQVMKTGCIIKGFDWKAFFSLKRWWWLSRHTCCVRDLHDCSLCNNDEKGFSCRQHHQQRVKVSFTERKLPEDRTGIPQVIKQRKKERKQENNPLRHPSSFIPDSRLSFIPPFFSFSSSSSSSPLLPASLLSWSSSSWMQEEPLSLCNLFFGLFLRTQNNNKKRRVSSYATSSWNDLVQAFFAFSVQLLSFAFLQL